MVTKRKMKATQQSGHPPFPEGEVTLRGWREIDVRQYFFSRSPSKNGPRIVSLQLASPLYGDVLNAGYFQLHGNHEGGSENTHVMIECPGHDVRLYLPDHAGFRLITLYGDKPGSLLVRADKRYAAQVIRRVGNGDGDAVLVGPEGRAERRGRGSGNARRFVTPDIEVTTTLQGAGLARYGPEHNVRRSYDRSWGEAIHAGSGRGDAFIKTENGGIASRLGGPGDVWALSTNPKRAIYAAIQWKSGQVHALAPKVNMRIMNEPKDEAKRQKHERRHVANEAA